MTRTVTFNEVLVQKIKRLEVKKKTEKFIQHSKKNALRLSYLASKINNCDYISTSNLISVLEKKFNQMQIYEFYLKKAIKIFNERLGINDERGKYLLQTRNEMSQKYINSFLKYPIYPNQQCLCCSQFFLKNYPIKSPFSDTSLLYQNCSATELMILSSDEIRGDDLINKIYYVLQKGGGFMMIGGKYHSRRLKFQTGSHLHPQKVEEKIKSQIKLIHPIAQVYGAIEVKSIPFLPTLNEKETRRLACSEFLIRIKILPKDLDPAFPGKRLRCMYFRSEKIGFSSLCWVMQGSKKLGGEQIYKELIAPRNKIKMKHLYEPFKCIIPLNFDEFMSNPFLSSRREYCFRRCLDYYLPQPEFLHRVPSQHFGSACLIICESFSGSTFTSLVKNLKESHYNFDILYLLQYLQNTWSQLLNGSYSFVTVVYHHLGVAQANSLISEYDRDHVGYHYVSRYLKFDEDLNDDEINIFLDFYAQTFINEELPMVSKKQIRICDRVINTNVWVRIQNEEYLNQSCWSFLFFYLIQKKPYFELRFDIDPQF